MAASLATFFISQDTDDDEAAIVGAKSIDLARRYFTSFSV